MMYWRDDYDDVCVAKLLD